MEEERRRSHAPLLKPKRKTIQNNGHIAFAAVLMKHYNILGAIKNRNIVSLANFFYCPVFINFYKSIL